MKHWHHFLSFFGKRHTLDADSCSFVRITLMLLLHYLVKCTSRNLVVYNNEFILGSACVTVESG